MTERLTADDRGVSEVVGAILIFGLLVTLLATIQSAAIPAANQEVEFNHNQEVRGDIISLQEAASRSGALGTTESVKMQVGATYPSRLLFVNPPNPSGAVRTVDTSNDVEISNVEAKNSDTRLYVDGDLDSLETQRFEYDPNYNEYQNPPTSVLEYGALYNEVDGDNIVLNGGSIIRGNTINLLFFAGDLERAASGSISIETNPTSAPARTVTVRPNNPGNPIVLRLPSKLSASQWEDILEDELVSNGGNVDSITKTGDNVFISLVAPSGTTYDLKMARVGIGPNPPQPSAVYTIDASQSTPSIGTGNQKQYTFEIRDKYNNPVSGEEVQIALNPTGNPNAGSFTPASPVETNGEGQVTVSYTAPPSTGTVELRASFANDPTTAAFDATNNKEDVKIDLQVRASASGNNPVINTLSVDSAASECTDTDTGGPLGTKLLGDEAANLSVDWNAQMPAGSTNDLDEVRIEMIDQSNGQTADSTRYDLPPGTSAASDTVILRDSRQNDDSCDKDYEVRMRVTSTGNKDEDADTPAQSGVDYDPDPASPTP